MLCTVPLAMENRHSIFSFQKLCTKELRSMPTDERLVPCCIRSLPPCGHRQKCHGTGSTSSSFLTWLACIMNPSHHPSFNSNFLFVRFLRVEMLKVVQEGYISFDVFSPRRNVVLMVSLFGNYIFETKPNFSHGGVRKES